MLRVHVSELKTDMRLARPVPMPSCPTRYLLQRDMRVTPDMGSRLKGLGVEEVWVRCDELAFLEDVVSVELHERQRELYSTIRGNFERFMRLSNAPMDMSAFQSSVGSLFCYLRQQGSGLMFLDKVQLFDDYLMCHSTNVCYLAMVLGMTLDWYLIEERQSLNAIEAKQVETLGLGCLLHDVGKLRVPKEILNKPGKLTADEMKEIQRHPQYGYEMVRGQVPLSAAQVILHHHQRWNGAGYPKPIDLGLDLPPLADKKIHVLARIAAIADVFDAATSHRVYSGAKTSVQVLSEILRFNRGHFDPVIEKTFFQVVPPFPVGTLVKLTNGFTAAVVDFDPLHPCRPNVKPIYYPDGVPCEYPDTREISLASTQDLAVEYVGKSLVTPYLFEVTDFPWMRETDSFAPALETAARSG